MSIGANRVVIERATESDGAEVFIVSDEDSEFARTGSITDGGAPGQRAAGREPTGSGPFGF